MQIQQDKSDVHYQITGYQPGQLWINHTLYTGSVIVQPHRLIYPWRPVRCDDLCAEDLDALIDHPLGILLVGTGEAVHFPDNALLHMLHLRAEGVECMTSRAACHTYTILCHENRPVTALFFDER